MKEHNRKNMQDAFEGDPDPLSEGANADPLCPECVEFRVKRGILRTQAPEGTETLNVIGPDRFYQIDLVLEDDTRVTFIIVEGAVGVDVTLDAGKRSRQAV